MKPEESDNTFRVKCPLCSKAIRATKSMRGRVAKCPRCDGDFRLPQRLKSRSSLQGTTSSATKNEALLKQEPERIPPFPRFALYMAWTTVALFAIGSFLYCLLYMRAQSIARANAANLRVALAITDAQQWMAGDDNLPQGKLIEEGLRKSLVHEDVTDVEAGRALLAQVQDRCHVIQMWSNIRDLIARGNAREAAQQLEQLLARAPVKEKEAAEKFLQALLIASSDSDMFAKLVALDETSFSAVEDSGELDDDRVTEPELQAILAATLSRNLPAARIKRAAIHAEFSRLAEAEAERARLENIRQKAVAERERRRLHEQERKRLGQESSSEQIERFLRDGRVGNGILEFQTVLVAEPENDTVRFQLAILQFFKAAERFGQSLYRHGFKPWNVSDHPLGLLIPANPNPEPISYQNFRRCLDNLIDDLDDVDATLAAIANQDVTASIRLSLIRLDIDSNGEPDPAIGMLLQEKLFQDFEVFPGNEEMYVDFDGSDATWLRIFCQLLAATADLVLSVDFEHVFDFGLASQYFENPAFNRLQPVLGRTEVAIVEPQRMRRIHRRIISVTELNPQMWQQIKSETDNLLEWIPNSRQTSVLGINVSQPSLDRWLVAVAELRTALADKLDVPLQLGQENEPLRQMWAFLETPPPRVQLQFMPFDIDKLPNQDLLSGQATVLSPLIEVFKEYPRWLGIVQE